MVHLLLPCLITRWYIPDHKFPETSGTVDAEFHEVQLRNILRTNLDLCVHRCKSWPSDEAFLLAGPSGRSGVDILSCFTVPGSFIWAWVEIINSPNGCASISHCQLCWFLVQWFPNLFDTSTCCFCFPRCTRFTLASTPVHPAMWSSQCWSTASVVLLLFMTFGCWFGTWLSCFHSVGNRSPSWLQYQSCSHRTTYDFLKVVLCFVV